MGERLIQPSVEHTYGLGRPCSPSPGHQADGKRTAEHEVIKPLRWLCPSCRLLRRALAHINGRRGGHQKGGKSMPGTRIYDAARTTILPGCERNRGTKALVYSHDFWLRHLFSSQFPSCEDSNAALVYKAFRTDPATSFTVMLFAMLESALRSDKRYIDLGH